MPQRDSDLVGERYRLLTKLGEGGFGSVWAAHDRFTDTDVALELLPPSIRRGLVHRDLKPGNVLIDSSGRVVVVDFGTAVGRALGTRDERGSDPRGTPAFAAPEQFVEVPVDARADLFAVGVMLFEALTGKNPRSSAGARTPLAAAARPDVIWPPEVAALVEELLSLDSDEPPVSAGEVLDLLAGAHLPRADAVPWAPIPTSHLACSSRPWRPRATRPRAPRSGSSTSPSCSSDRGACTD